MKSIRLPFLLASLGVFLALAALIVTITYQLQNPTSSPRELSGVEKKIKFKNGESLTPVTVDVVDYKAPPDDDSMLVDDVLADKKTTFDPKLIDRRPKDGYVINTSEAVVKLDSPMVLPDQNPEMPALYPSYSDALTKANWNVLPSVNLIDGKAKQFDDGLYAALDQAHYLGHGETLKSHLKLIRDLHAKVEKGSSADDYLAAGLLLAKENIEASAKARSIADAFASQEIFAKPISFYQWTPALSDCFRVLRYFSRPIGSPDISDEITKVLKSDPALLADYQKAVGFYAKLTNPLVGRTPATVIEHPDQPAEGSISLFPPSTSKETELFKKLFPLGMPSDANLMRELITAIRSGQVDLKPRKDAGWYEQQVFALETLLLPERGSESNKLLLTKKYKKRLLEAFKALMTKRRETHARTLEMPMAAAAPPPAKLEDVSPRLRVEPNPTFFLRTARSYAFLLSFLESSVGEASLKSLHGLKEKGQREADLWTELHTMRDLFYGLHLLSCEDIGMKPDLASEEAEDRAACEKIATDWLAQYRKDPDLAVDTRVSVPIYFDPQKNTTRLWMTIGVRLTPLEASYAKPPQARPENKEAPWQLLKSDQLATAYYAIAVDEFAEVEMAGGRVLNRAELRAICDQMKTKEKIIEAIRKR